MSNVPLAKLYAKENYAKALSNLVKRYQSEGGPIHYSDTAFDEVSEDQAQSALKFFGDIGLIKIEKQAHYVPPESVVTWQQSMAGPAKQEAKSEVLGLLKGYDVYKEIAFLLNDGARELKPLARDVGGKLGISEDDFPMLLRSIEVLGACGFLEIDDENSVTLSDKDASLVDEESSDGKESDNGQKVEFVDGNGSGSSNFVNREVGVGFELSFSIDATDLSDEDLRSKLAIIKEVLLDDGD